MQTPVPHIVEVAIPLPLEGSFHYLVPERLSPQAAAGKRVLVPFGRRKVTGYLLGDADVPGAGELKEVLDILDEEPLFTASELEFFRWIAGYYLHPLGEVIKMALPAGINLVSRYRCEQGEDGTPVLMEFLAGGRKVRTERYFIPIPDAERRPRGKGLEILEYLMEMGECAAAELRTRFGNCTPQLNRLVQLGAARVEAREVYRDPFRSQQYQHDGPLPLNPAQAQALERLSAAVEGGTFAPFLLHGVTGSGKTEVYLQTIAVALAAGRSALVMVPEIALTPQLVGRFKRRFDCGIAVLHSGLSDGERYDEWRRIRRGEASIVIGARSALFAPLTQVGVIVVDEEHEGSYKQSEGVRYNARDLALVRGKLSGAVVILGSATPLVTSYHAAMNGRLGYLQLPDRVRELPMPQTEMLDARRQKGEVFLPQLIEAMGENLDNGGQTLLFLNRRGFATYLVCESCGHVLRCPNCEVTLTFHRLKGKHVCHYCDFSMLPPKNCPHCGDGEITLLGRGTERVEEQVQQLFPHARVSRMDRDTTRGKGGHARVLKELEDGEVDILIGTQMIAKGHDFPGVTLVGVLSADASLNLPDFRSAERTFQLVTQVMGRAGRGDKPGRVLVQTLAPEHYALTRAVTHDFEGFYREEIAFREEVGYPPFAHLASLTLSAVAASQGEHSADEAAALLQKIKRECRLRVEVLGPVTAPLGKVRGRFRWQILLKGRERADLHRLLFHFRGGFSHPSTVRLTIDVDPVDML
ncbi:primosomal protein N' [Geoanaerobacter pelophilus]|uniref:Replication restart protein PriA n=1 Tax=Geoanaerobacter pelophilus TaxID=60036 RepID=A0ABQ0MM41_9BACT|nr:primosomal protein N' [Geoanaerobacter pelophilus]GAW68140.1 primosomal protein N' [Geoanaerobacter pelophilus]